MDQTTRVNLVRSLSKTEENGIPVSTAAELAGVNRTSIYRKERPVSRIELESKAIIDRLHTDNPTWGARQISSQLKQRGYRIGRKRAWWFMTEMASALDDTFRQAEDVSEMTLDEINAKIADARANYREGKISCKRFLFPEKDSTINIIYPVAGSA